MPADSAKAHIDAGNAFLGQGQLDSAAAAFRQAIALSPRTAAAHYNLGFVLQRQGRLDEAVAAYGRALQLKPDYAQALNNLGAALQRQGRLKDAAAAYRRVIAIRPEHAKAHYNLGVALQHLGDLDEAASCYRQAIALKPDYASAHYNLTLQWPMGDGSPQAEAAFALLRRQIDNLDAFSPKDRSLLLFALGAVLEARGDIDGAVKAMAQANALRRAGLSFDPAEPERRMAEVAQAFDARLLHRLAGQGLASERPVFVIGVPRSGSTLVEQIISAHPDVHGAGETGALAALAQTVRAPDGSAYPAWAKTMTGVDCRTLGQAYINGLPADGPGRRRVTDKTLANFELVGLIHLCLPHAVIIHCRRDPRDACLSAFAMQFQDGHEHAYDLRDLGRHWSAYDRLMAHWRAVLPPGRMLDVPYEALVEDVEGWARRMIAHCGLEWDDACLRFHQSGREVHTASFAQVRRPIYSSSVGRWRRFAPHLEPLLEALGEPWTAEASHPA